ncbi:RNA-binding cell elongation regulator Jag/EloR [Tepidibacillus fermentans]|uniref:RNA-binding protein KhpB n=1 Tax=Tepidibacillus fermentans TaxID=1281767 RepID=A0A4R3KD07_9BACI|nr:RNA-binding cell elongation regulator Jag/EloR [Tepidibacillus fermentans]TCS80819.1 spoIIIJ-associated protein [Tepidibacillus fermentans]
MEKIIATGKTVEEAINSALRRLNTTEDKVKIKVIEQPGKRFFGLIGRKDAVVEVTLISESESIQDTLTEKTLVEDKTEVNAVNQMVSLKDPIEEAKEFLANVFKKMELTVEIEVTKEEEQTIFNLIGNDLGILIGRRGQTLDSLQYLTNIVANRYVKDQRLRIVLDAENYRSRRKATLEELAMKLADRVVRTGKDVILEPMSPHERKIIHSKLQNHPKVQTISQGEEPNRKVMITRKY